MASAPRPLRVLFVHGFAQTGDIFRSRSGGFRKALAGAAKACGRGLEPVFIDAPLRLSATRGDGLRGLCWWNGEDRSPELPTDTAFDQPVEPLEAGDMATGTRVLVGLHEAIRTIHKELSENGPYDGVVAFSQGAMLVSMVIALEAMQRGGVDFSSPSNPVRFPPSAVRLAQECDFNDLFQFVIPVSGRLPTDGVVGPTVGALSEFAGQKGALRLKPTLHVVGRADLMVEPKYSLEMRDFFSSISPDSVFDFLHDGGHQLPGNAAMKEALRKFIAEQVLSESAEGPRANKL